MATELNKMWRELDEKDQEIYRGKAKKEEEVATKKQREYEAELKAWKDAGGVLLEEEDAPNDPPKPPAKPVKKAATAYFLFSSDRRTQVRAQVCSFQYDVHGLYCIGSLSLFVPHASRYHQNPGASVAVIAKELGKIWNTLSDEEKQPYNELAATERERVAQELNVWEKEYAEYEEKLKAWKEAGGVLDEEPVAASFSTNLVFPVARIKKIAKLDPEVRGISKDALLLITKCAELATARLGTETVRVARAQNRRKLLPEDVAQVCSSREQFLFLKDDIKDLVREMLPAKTDKKDVGKAAAQNRLDANFEAAAGTKRLASYFGGSNETGNEDSTGTAKPVSKKEKKEAEVSITAAKKNVEAAKGTKPLTSYFGGSKA